MWASGVRLLAADLAVGGWCAPPARRDWRTAMLLNSGRGPTSVSNG